jgi:hypothetical protein
MGGGNSVLNKPLGSTGDKALGKNNFFTNAANMAISSVATGGVSTLFNNNNPVSVQNTLRNVGEGLGEITGSNALRKQAMDQQQANEEEAKRQAMVSDAMARSQGGDATNIFLATGKRGKGGKGGSTGSAGTGSSRETGVQS